MKYWLLTTEFPPFFGGGISTYCNQTSQMLAAAGHSITVFMPVYDSGEGEQVLGEHLRVIRFNPSKSPTIKFLGFEANLSYVFAEKVSMEIERTGKPDIIESQEYLGIAYYLLQKKHMGYPLLQGIKIILTLHAPTFLYFDFNQVPLYKHPNFWTGEMERFCIRAADLCISPSAYLIEAIRNRVDLSNLDLHVLPNPFESDYLNKPVPDFIPGEVIFYGKLIPQKGCIELLRYFAELWEQGSNIRLRMIGGGKHFFHPFDIDLPEYLLKKYKKYAKQGLLILEGEISPEELAEKLGKAHIILVPSIVDNLPYAVLEAMSAGKLVLASSQGGQSEVIDHGIDGFLFDHRIAGSFAKTLLHILSLTNDRVMETGRLAKKKIRDRYAYSIILDLKMQLVETAENKAESSTFPLIRPVSGVQHDFKAENKLLTVVVPYYNMGKYIDETINSIKASDYQYVKILIVNDGSTEKESQNALKKYETDPHIQVIHKKNEGLPLARNAGAILAEGDFLAFLDPDDTVEPSYYAKAIGLLQKKQTISFVGCWAQYFGESNAIWPSFNPEPPYVLLHNCLNTSALVYKRSHFMKSGLNDPNMIYGMEDYESLIHMLSTGYRGVALPETLWNYRIRKNSMAQSFTINSKLYLYKLIAEKHAAFYAEFSAQLFLLLNSNGPSLNIDNPTLNTGIYSKFASSSAGRKLVSLLKRNKYLRQMALFVYKKL